MANEFDVSVANIISRAGSSTVCKNSGLIGPSCRLRVIITRDETAIHHGPSALQAVFTSSHMIRIIIIISLAMIEQIFDIVGDL